jgi:hypothetical protein
MTPCRLIGCFIIYKKEQRLVIHQMMLLITFSFLLEYSHQVLLLNGCCLTSQIPSLFRQQLASSGQDLSESYCVSSALEVL